MAEAELTEVFDAAFLRRLENLHLQVRKVLSGSLRAERRSRKTGSSLEFADYRNYAPATTSAAWTGASTPASTAS